jgi:hypothetical protein
MRAKVAMKTTTRKERTKDAPPESGEGWLLSDEALIRIILEAGRSDDRKRAILPKAA